MTVYVFAYRGHEAEVILVEADTEAEAVGKATLMNGGVQPLGDPEPLPDVLEDNAVVRLA